MDSILSYIKSPLSFSNVGKKVIFNAAVESYREYIEPTKVYTHKIQLLFAPYGLPFIPLEIVGTDAGTIISSFSWTKDRSNPGGMLSLELQPDSRIIEDMVKILNKISGNLYSKIWGTLGVDLEDLFKPMTLCQFWIDGLHVMTGTVRSCHRSARIGDKDFTNSYTLSIDELGNIYTRNTMRFDTIVSSLSLANYFDSNTKILTAVANLKMVPLSEGIPVLVNAFIASGLFEQGMSLSDGVPLSLRLIAAPDPLGAIARIAFGMNLQMNANMFGLEGQSFWDFMKNFIPSPWMEFFTESGGRTMVNNPWGIPSIMFPGFNYVVARSVPYSNPILGVINPAHYAQTFLYELNALTLLIGGDFVIITDDDIIDKTLGFDCSNQATSFRANYAGQPVTPANSQDKPIQTIGPMNPFASGGMNTFGKIEMMQTINAVQMYDAGVGLDYASRIAENGISFPGIMSKQALSNLLAVWYRNQSKFREGTITTRILPQARAGMYLLYLPTWSGKKVENIRDIGIYYIDSLSHQMNVGGHDVSATTTFNVIRGLPLPSTIAQTALLLFDFEIIPPVSGLWDGEFKILQTARKALMGI